jgi:hypothetical protein
MDVDTLELDPRLRHAAGFLGQTPLMLIDGELVPAVSGKTFAVYNPATGAVIANVPEADKRMSISQSRPHGAPSMKGAGARSVRRSAGACCGSSAT